MRWVTPILYIGTLADAKSFQSRGMDYNAVTTAREAVALMEQDRGAIVPTREIAADVIRTFGASEEWVESHVMRDWGLFPGF